jgi:hypothetical protein
MAFSQTNRDPIQWVVYHRAKQELKGMDSAFKTSSLLRTTSAQWEKWRLTTKTGPNKRTLRWIIEPVTRVTVFLKSRTPAGLLSRTTTPLTRRRMGRTTICLKGKTESSRTTPMWWPGRQPSRLPRSDGPNHHSDYKLSFSIFYIHLLVLHNMSYINKIFWISNLLD